MHVRQPAVAGHFYPGSRRQCEAELEACLESCPVDPQPRLTGSLIGGVVPHAGWIYSGAVAAQAIGTLARNADAETYVVFGAVHRRSAPHASVFARGAWSTPLGDIPIDEPLAQAVIGASANIVEDPAIHGGEWSIEVEVPFIQRLAPGVRLLPIMIPPLEDAHLIGRLVAEQANALGRKAVYLASTDLTHYGPMYAFTPHGEGIEGIRWAKEVNDRRMLDLIEAGRADQAVGEAMAHRNACGSGAVAATLAACQTGGAGRARLLRHTTSYEVMPDRQAANAVGYAGMVF